MADAIETTEEVVEAQAEDVVVDDKDDVFNVGGEDDIPFPDEATAEAQVEPEEETPAAAPTFQHSPELIEKAVNALFTVEEIAAMSPEALRTAIHGAHRIAQAVVEAGVKKEPAKAGPDDDDDDDDDMAALDDPERFTEDTIKAVLKKQAKRLDELEKENKALLAKHGQTEAQALHSRLMGIAAQASPDLPKTFNLATPAGKQKYTELLQIMGAVHRANQGMPEPKLLERALKAMDLAPEKSAKPAETETPELAARKRAWDGGALGGKPNNKKPQTAVDRVGEILSGIRNGTKPVNGVKPAKK